MLYRTTSRVVVPLAFLILVGLSPALSGWSGVAKADENAVRRVEDNPGGRLADPPPLPPPLRTPLAGTRPVHDPFEEPR